ncbi:MAG TPA: sensor domain-containing diguanylate cyclase, partial [Aminobacteriaceae bacterium]|nr:sensor domain-containing diguanylate cyclase [Aminobacteriaceae bacterium]
YRQIATISEVGQRIASHLDLESSLATIQNAINNLMDASTVILALVDEEKQLLDYRYVICRGERRESFTRPLDMQSFGCWCVRNRSDIIIGDLESEYSRYVPSYKGLVFEGVPESSLVYIPLILEERVVGMLSVQSTRQHAYDQQKVKVLHAIGGYIAISIENSRLFSQIERLASTDELTALPNRRTVMEELAKVCRRTRRYGWVSGVVMADVDHFKRINDMYGHDIGDVALRSIAGALASSVRESDMVGRFGGEEFVVVLQETDSKGALLLAERLRKTVEGLEISGPHGESLRVTASFGVSVVSQKDPDCHPVLKRADDALYEAKATGRNRVCSRLPEDGDA